jgi:hypothetical protein
MTVVSVSDKDFSRLDVLLDIEASLDSGSLRVDGLVKTASVSVSRERSRQSDFQAPRPAQQQPTAVRCPRARDEARQATLR